MYTDLGAELQRIRKFRQFSLRAFGYCCGISKSTVKDIEEGRQRGTKELWRRFNRILSWNFEIPSDIPECGNIKLRPMRINPLVKEQRTYGPAMLPHRELKRWSFTEGVEYSIDEVKYKFLRKEGIHHIFMRSGFSWLTTYTDNQLVGAAVKN